MYIYYEAVSHKPSIIIENKLRRNRVEFVLFCFVLSLAMIFGFFITWVTRQLNCQWIKSFIAHEHIELSFFFILFYFFIKWIYQSNLFRVMMQSNNVSTRHTSFIYLYQRWHIANKYRTIILFNPNPLTVWTNIYNPTLQLCSN